MGSSGKLKHTFTDETEGMYYLFFGIELVLGDGG